MPLLTFAPPARLGRRWTGRIRELRRYARSRSRRPAPRAAFGGARGSTIGRDALPAGLGGGTPARRRRCGALAAPCARLPRTRSVGSAPRRRWPRRCSRPASRARCSSPAARSGATSLPTRLRHEGIEVDEVVCYRSVLAGEAAARAAARARGASSWWRVPSVADLLARASRLDARPPLLAVGPTTAAAARASGWPPAAVAAHPDVEALVAGVRSLPRRAVGSMNDLFLRACRREPVERPPVWMMRQAGRYLPEYRAVRARADFLTMVGTPELAVEVTLQPVDLLGVDAAIIFSDILVVPAGDGHGAHGGGGHRARGSTIRSRSPRRSRPAAAMWMPEQRPAATCSRRCAWRAPSLAGRVPLIGFAGAPWTLMSYMVEGSGTKSFTRAKRFLVEQPRSAHALLERLAATVGRVPRGAGRGGRAGGAALRFLGRRARAARLPRVRAPVPGGVGADCAKRPECR